MRFFGCNDTPIYHVEVNNCTLEVTSPTTQSGCVRFSNSTNTIGGTPIGEDGYFNRINFTNCVLIGNASTNLSIYTYHAYVSAKFSNCDFYNVVYFDETNKEIYLRFNECYLAEMLNVKENAHFVSISLDNCDVKGIYKNSNYPLVLNTSNTSFVNAISISGNSADYVHINGGLISPNNVILNTENGTFNITNTRVSSGFTFSAGNAKYYLKGLSGLNGNIVITSATNAKSISGGVKVDGKPSTPVDGDYILIGNLLKYYLSGEWLNVNMTAE